jgi:hypothetical protein
MLSLAYAAVGRSQSASLGRETTKYGLSVQCDWSSSVSIKGTSAIHSRKPLRYRVRDVNFDAAYLY